MTTRARAAGGPPGGSAVLARSPLPVRWLAAVVQTSRPRQWPKNLLVFAAPLAAASAGPGRRPGVRAGGGRRVHHGRSRRLLRQRRRGRGPGPAAPGQAAPCGGVGRLPRTHALGLAVLGRAGRRGRVPVARRAHARRAGRRRTWPCPSCTRSCSSTFPWSSWRSWRRASCCARSAARPRPGYPRPAGSWWCAAWARCWSRSPSATPSSPCSARTAAAHRPSMRWYRPAALRLSQRIAAGAMIIAYLLWAVRRARWLDPRAAPAQRAAAGRGAACGSTG